MRELVHTATIEVQGVEIRMASSYSLDIDLLQPADGYQLTVPLDARTVGLIPLDAEIDVRIDDQAVVTGFVGSLEETADDNLVVSGRCRTGRLVDESVDGAGFSLTKQTRLRDAVKKIVGQWYSTIDYRGIDKNLRIPHRVKCEPGTLRMEALDRVLEPLRVLSWADGRRSTLVIATPKYEQEAVFNFVLGGHHSNVLSMTRKRSIENRYRDYEIGSTSSTGNRLGHARDESGDFLHDKRLYTPFERDSDNTAYEQARRTMAQANASAYELQVVNAGHGQVRPGDDYATIFQPDRVARCVRLVRTSPMDDTLVTLYDHPAYITRVTYSADADGARTTLSLVPLHTELV